MRSHSNQTDVEKEKKKKSPLERPWENKIISIHAACKDGLYNQWNKVRVEKAICLHSSVTKYFPCVNS